MSSDDDDYNDLLYVYQEFDVARKSRMILCNHGIKTFSDLVRHKKDLQQKNKIEGIRPIVLRTLVDIVEWYETRLEDEGHRVIDLRNDLNDDVLEDFKNCRTRQDFMLFEFVVNTFHNEGGCEEIRKRRPNMDCESIIEFGRSKIMEGRMGADVRSTAWCPKFTYLWLKAILNLPSQEPYSKTFIVAGKTQSGKSAVKSVMQAICSELNCPLIVITKGVAESQDLCAKLKYFARKSRRPHMEQNILCASLPKGRRWKLRENELRAALCNGGVLVLADTAQQMDRAIQAIRWYRKSCPKEIDRRASFDDGDGGDNFEEDLNKKFIVVVDEADAMYRTEERSQKMEEKYDELMALGPRLKVLISATPIPLMLLSAMKDESLGLENPPDMLSIEPSHDYIGIRDMQPFQIDGIDQFFEQKEVSCSGLNGIPYCCPKMLRLYDDAVLQDRKQGILLLDVTNPRVYVDKNIFDKASEVQEMYERKGRRIIVVVHVGSGIHFRTGTYQGTFTQVDKEQGIPEVLNEIDSDLLIPIFVFGFSKMSRCISYRSDKRVPTHIVMSLGNGYSYENVVQTLGRATYNGKLLLKENIGQNGKVQVLTTACDWESVTRYQRFVEELQKRVDRGESVHKALFESKHDSSFNYLKFGNRKTGQYRKGVLSPHVERIQFRKDPNDHPLNSNERLMKQELHNDVQAQRVMRVLYELREKENGRFLPIESIIEAYDDTFKNFGGGFARISLRDLRSMLNRLFHNSLVDKSKDSDKASAFTWRGRKVLNRIINENLAYSSLDISYDDHLDVPSDLDDRSSSDSDNRSRARSAFPSDELSHDGSGLNQNSNAGSACNSDISVVEVILPPSKRIKRSNLPDV